MTSKTFSNGELAKIVYDRHGLNIYALFNRFKKVSKLRNSIPNEVVNAVCIRFIKEKERLLSPWSWFLKVLLMETHRFYAEKNIREHEKIKKTPGVRLSEILRRCRDEEEKNS
jgi:hypothetical protein